MFSDVVVIELLRSHVYALSLIWVAEVYSLRVSVVDGRSI